MDFRKVSEARLSPDQKHATVFARPLGGENTAEVIEALNRHAKYLRKLRPGQARPHDIEDTRQVMLQDVQREPGQVAHVNHLKKIFAIARKKHLLMRCGAGQPGRVTGGGVTRASHHLRTQHR